MVRRLIFIALGLVLALAISSFAGEPGNSQVVAKSEFRFDIREAERINTVVKGLSAEIDLWHDAALKRNGKRMRSHEKRIFDIIENDIQARDRVIYRFENEVVRSTANVVGEPGRPAEAPIGEQVEMRDDIKDLRQARQLVKAKELLFDSIKRTETFSNRYRLLGDYLEIVKREGRLNTVEVAEDGRQIRKN
jgi:hypothetical protein